MKPLKTGPKNGQRKEIRFFLELHNIASHSRFQISIGLLLLTNKFRKFNVLI